MRLQVLSAVIVLAASAAAAQPTNQYPPTATTQCIEANGQAIPPVCNAPASRIDQAQFICTCPAGGQSVEVAICGEGERPPPEGAALNRARRESSRDGSLMGDTFEGKPICVAARNRPGR